MKLKRSFSRLMLVAASSLVLVLSACGSDDDDEDGDNSNFTLKGSDGSSASLAGTPSASTITVYKFAVSTSKTCADPIVVFEEEAGKAVNMAEGPEIGSGELANGTYECVVMEMSDLLAFTPAVTDGNCKKDEAVEANVCRTGSTSQLIDGTEVTCKDNETNKVAVYISTASEATSQPEDAFNPPTTNSGDPKGVNLASKLVVSAALTGLFTMDTTNTLEDMDGRCDMAPPVFGFAKVNANK